MTQFGISTEQKSSNSVNFSKRGIYKVYLTDVKVEEVGKDTKFTVLSFNFSDAEGIKSFKHSEFIVDSTDEKFEKKLNGFNSRVKHIFETYIPFPKSGIGFGATSFEDYFTKIAESFNTGNEGLPIFKTKEGASILVWIKLAFYNTKGNIGFPLSPNFIEKVKADNQTEAKTLNIDPRYDKEQVVTTTPQKGIIGDGGAPSDEHDF